MLKFSQTSKNKFKVVIELSRAKFRRTKAQLLRDGVQLEDIEVAMCLAAKIKFLDDAVKKGWLDETVNIEEKKPLEFDAKIVELYVLHCLHYDESLGEDVTRLAKLIRLQPQTMAVR